MGKFQAMHKCFLVLMVLVSFHGFHLSHGRKIMKPLNTNINEVQKNDDLKPTTTTLAPHKTSLIINVPNPSPKKVKTPTLRFVVDSSADTNAFRPTTPGSSPGVGHKKFSEEEVQSPSDVKVSVMSGASSKNDFKPTDPGHSPGVGHAYPNKNGRLN